MKKIRIIPRLDIKGPNLIKGIQLEGLRVIGDPKEYATRYYQQGADELIYMDCVASLYGRNHLLDIIEKTASEIFIPLTVGGGLRSIDDVRQVLRVGADKVAINTQAVRDPSLISKVAQTFGRQCMVVSIEAKQVGALRWEAYTDNGREKTGLEVVAWAKQAESLGAGELLLTSVDKEGMRKGFDLDLIKAVSQAISIPLIVSGGMGKILDLVALLEVAEVDAIAIASVLHYQELNLIDIREEVSSLRGTQ